MASFATSQRKCCRNLDRWVKNRTCGKGKSKEQSSELTEHVPLVKKLWICKSTSMPHQPNSQMFKLECTIVVIRLCIMKKQHIVSMEHHVRIARTTIIEFYEFKKHGRMLWSAGYTALVLSMTFSMNFPVFYVLGFSCHFRKLSKLYLFLVNFFF